MYVYIDISLKSSLAVLGVTFAFVDLPRHPWPKWMWFGNGGKALQQFSVDKLHQKWNDHQISSSTRESTHLFLLTQSTPIPWPCHDPNNRTCCFPWLRVSLAKEFGVLSQAKKEWRTQELEQNQKSWHSSLDYSVSTKIRTLMKRIRNSKNFTTCPSPRHQTPLLELRKLSCGDPSEVWIRDPGAEINSPRSVEQTCVTNMAMDNSPILCRGLHLQMLHFPLLC